jgi:hypothetical protein
VAPLVRRFLSMGVAVFMMACGGGGSGSGGGNAGEDAVGHSVLLRWRAEADAAGYVIHWGLASGVYTHALDVGDPTPDEDGIVSFTLDDVAVTGAIYVALTSYDGSATMSALSNELSATVP